MVDEFLAALLALVAVLQCHLEAGAQKFTPGQHDPAQLTYSQSITDGCLGWGDSVAVLEQLSDAVRGRRNKK